jgi:hypothetical protein
MKVSHALFIPLTIAVVMTGLSSCASSREKHPEPKLGVTSGSRLSIDLVPGPYYEKKVNLVVYSYTVWPQVAVWLETAEGEYVDTLYATEVVVTGKYNAAPKTGRPEALPVWSAIVASAKRPVDAVTSPTTVGSDVRYGNDIVSRLPAGRYLVKLETNRSYDWNATYTKANSGVNGQPSLVYEAALDIGGSGATVPFVPVGTGSVDGSNGIIRKGIDGIDTALELFSAMTVTYFPE